MALKIQGKNIPSSPGVYFFSAKDGSASGGKNKILYIGKAANLRARLNSYKEMASLKTKNLLKESGKLDWLVLNSETEALIKESELIKKYQPKYNVLMRDDKQYFFVALTKEIYPRIYLTHQTPKGPEYIGPFTDGAAIKLVLKLLRRAFPYCTCKKAHKTQCLNSRIGKCYGYCCTAQILNPKSEIINKSQIQNYKKNINSIKSVLVGKNKSLIKSLKKEMKKSSLEQRYENSAVILNQIRALEKIFAHKEIISRDFVAENIKSISALESILKINNINRIEAYDIANIQGKYAYGSMAVFVNGAPQKDLYRIFKIKSVFGANDVAMLKEILTRRFLHKEWQYPDVVLVDGGKQQLNAIESIRSSVKGLVALTKDKKHKGNHIYISGKKSPLPLDAIPLPLKNLLLHLDSEAHRFAIRHYRHSHRNMLSSS